MSATVVVGDPRAEGTGSPALGLRDAVDGLFALALTTVALFGWRSTFTGWSYLVSGGVAAVIGVLITMLVAAWRKSVLLTGLFSVLAYYLFAGVLVFRTEATAGFLPNLSVLGDASTVTVNGWLRLLTTLPPVASAGLLMALPYLLGMLSGVTSSSFAARTRSRLLPVVPPLVVFVVVTLTGRAQPSAQLWQGLAFGLVVVVWSAVRRDEQRSITIRGVPGGVSRLVVGAVVLAVAGVGAAYAGPHLYGHGTKRQVLRTYVKPPFDLTDFASPLVGFRKYTKSANQLYDQTLFTEAGLPADSTIRIATLDDYNGSVWGATNATVPSGPDQPLDAFQRVGPHIDSGARGRQVHATVTIGAPYAAAAELAAWVPVVGTLRSIDFQGSRAGDLDQEFRYNLATGSGVAGSRLFSGDSYSFEAVTSPTTIPTDAAPFGAPTLAASEDAFVSGRANQWSASADGVLAQARAVARYMRVNGAYSDGGADEGEYRPGHSVNRLTAFLNSPQLVGDDEQYAAAYALICNYLGLPARVVVVAEPEPNGRIKGKDIHTAVDVHIRTGTRSEWVTIPRTRFMPDTTKKPSPRPMQTIQNADAAVVPPPNPAKPPSSLDQQDRPDQNIRHLPPQSSDQGGLHGVSMVLVYYVAVPVAALLLLCALIVAIKWRRRATRRGRGSTPRRFEAGWRDYLDAARDLGASVPRGRTRHEQATALATRPAGEQAVSLAAAADAGIFGAGVPSDDAVRRYWADVDAARRAMSRKSGRLRRVVGALNLRSLWRPTKTSLT